MLHFLQSPSSWQLCYSYPPWLTNAHFKYFKMLCGYPNKVPGVHVSQSCEINEMYFSCNSGRISGTISRDILVLIYTHSLS